MITEVESNPSITKRKCIFVLGMHRSGTSALAGLLQILGIDLGEDLMAGNEFNEKGYFEHNEVFELNEEILTSLEINWHTTYLLDENWVNNSTTHDWIPRIEALIQKNFTVQEFFAVKDPRLSILYRLWDLALRKNNLACHFIIMLRPFHEIYQSLLRRDGFDQKKSALVWMDHLLSAEGLTRGKSRLLIEYHQLIQDPWSVSKKICKLLDLDINLDEKMNEIKHFLSESLNHASTFDEDLNSTDSFIPKLLHLLKQVDESKEDSTIQSQIDRLRLQHQKNKSLYIQTVMKDNKSILQHLSSDLVEKKLIEMSIQETLKEQQKDYEALRTLFEMQKSKNMENQELLKDLGSEIITLTQKTEDLNSQIGSRKDKSEVDRSIMNKRVLQQEEFQQLELTNKILELRIGELESKVSNYELASKPRTRSYKRSLKTILVSGIHFVVQLSKKVTLYPKMLSSGLRNPPALLKMFNSENIKTLWRAIHHEDTTQILNNFRSAFNRTQKLLETKPGENPDFLFAIDEVLLIKSKLLTLRGWVLSAEPIEEIVIRSDSNIIGEIKLGRKRPDVSAVYYDFKNSSQCGFQSHFLLEESKISDLDSLRLVVKRKGSKKIVPLEFRATESFPGMNLDDQYQIYLTLNSYNKNEILQIEEECRQFGTRPKISIITPVYNVPSKWLDLCIESVRSQYYDNWELCLYDDCSSNEDTLSCLQKWKDSGDERIRVKFGKENGNISFASNQAVAMSSGSYIGLLDHDDEITPDALYQVVKTINSHPDCNLIYSDECKLEPDGTPTGPYFKSDLNIDLLRSNNYICHFTVIKKTIGDKVGWFEEGLEGSQDHDLILKVVDSITPFEVHHIPRVLYHWRKIPGSTAMSYHAKNAFDAGKKSIENHLQRNNLKAQVKKGNWGGAYKIQYEIMNPKAKIVIVIPFKDEVRLLKKCIESIYSKTRYQNYEILLVNNNSEKRETLEYLAKLANNPKNLRILHDTRPFNFSQINNWAVENSDSEFILFLNNDTEVLSEGWLEEMVSLCQRSEIGAVGAKLLYPDKTLQHAGVVLGIGGIAGHAFKGRSDTFHYYNMGLVRNVGACTGACLMVKRDVFLEVGGFDPVNLKVAFNDIDLCLKIRKAGYLITYSPYAILYHYESKSRGYEDTPEKLARHNREKEFIVSKWGDFLTDPYYNKNLTIHREDYSLRLE